VLFVLALTLSLGIHFWPDTPRKFTRKAAQCRPRRWPNAPACWLK
jgi:hypothetical protein